MQAVSSRGTRVPSGHCVGKPQLSTFLQEVVPLVWSENLFPLLMRFSCPPGALNFSSSENVEFLWLWWTEDGLYWALLVKNIAPMLMSFTAGERSRLHGTAQNGREKPKEACARTSPVSTWCAFSFLITHKTVRNPNTFESHGHPSRSGGRTLETEAKDVSKIIKKLHNCDNFIRCMWFQFSHNKISVSLTTLITTVKYIIFTDILEE